MQKVFIPALALSAIVLGASWPAAQARPKPLTNAQLAADWAGAVGTGNGNGNGNVGIGNGNGNTGNNNGNGNIGNNNGNDNVGSNQGNGNVGNGSGNGSLPGAAGTTSPASAAFTASLTQNILTRFQSVLVEVQSQLAHGVGASAPATPASH